MKYYKVKPEVDQKRRKDGYTYIANELYTEKEAANFDIDISLCDLVEVSKKATYFCFGARFA